MRKSKIAVPHGLNPENRTSGILLQIPLALYSSAIIPKFLFTNNMFGLSAVGDPPAIRTQDLRLKRALLYRLS